MTNDAAATVQAWASIVQAVGVIGALAVGVGVPLWQQRQARKVSVSITPVLAWPVPTGFLTASTTDRFQEFTERHGLPTIGFEIRNTSLFTVTIAEVGLCEGHPARGARARLNEILTASAARLPLPMEPHTTVTLYASRAMMSYSFGTATRAFIKTESGTAAVGTSRAFDRWCETKPWLVEDGRLAPS